MRTAEAVLLCAVAVAAAFTYVQAEARTPVKCVVESCAGCRLNRLPEVKQFIYEDLEKYDGTEFKRMPGKPPVMFFYDAEGHIVEKHEMDPKKRVELNAMLVERGFSLKEDNVDDAKPKHDEI